MREKHGWWALYCYLFNYFFQKPSQSKVNFFQGCQGNPASFLYTATIYWMYCMILVSVGGWASLTVWQLWRTWMREALRTACEENPPEELQGFVGVKKTTQACVSALHNSLWRAGHHQHMHSSHRNNQVVKLWMDNYRDEACFVGVCWRRDS